MDMMRTFMMMRRRRMVTYTTFVTAMISDDKTREIRQKSSRFKL